MDTEQVQELNQRLAKIEETLNALVMEKVPKDFYSTAEVAEMLGKAEFTVREWCRLSRIHAEKRRCGRGRFQEWIISHDELTRFRNEGLLPMPRFNQPR